MSGTLKNILKGVICALLGVAILKIAITGSLQSAFNFPKPTGQYAVGMKTYDWIDTTRTETLPDNPDPAHPHRELMVNIWYPAQGAVAEKPTAPYVPYFVDWFKKNNKLIWFIGFSRPSYSYAQPEAAIAPDMPRYPVIIFSHGSGGRRDSNTAQCEALASHGYIVVGISHTYDSCVVQFPDGRIIDGAKSTAQRTQRNRKKSFVERRKLHDQEIIENRISDVQFVLDQLERIDLDRESVFYQRLDKENMGVFGQSFGGSTAVQACRRDVRVKAGADLDGSLFGSDATKKLDKPFMFILAGNSVKMFDEQPMNRKNWNNFGVKSLDEETMLRARYLDGFEQLADHDIYTFVLRGAGHVDLTDSALFKHASPLARLLFALGIMTSSLGTGSINGFRATEIVNAYLVNFFDKYLKNQPSELLDGDKRQYTEIETKHWAR